ncbi:MAG: adenylate cyclase [Phycisphaerales bacterium]|jgi:predicted adenylyl cyclase CyaB|nr:adenylate cyclase [Phycisphaerales bacterium]
MPVEIEAKMAVADLDVVRARLAECGAQPLGKFMEVNTFYDTDDRTLLAGDRGLRLRLNRNLQTNEEDHILTYKGPRQPGALKSREEVELGVEGSAEAMKLLESLDYHKMLAFEKRRESWMLDGCRVELDELPHLGTYVEVEGPDEPTVMKARQKLNLSNSPLIKTGYVALLTGYLQEHGRATRDIKFP